MTWRVAWHSGFGGTCTAETDNWIEFRRTLGHTDWFEVFGAYVRQVP